MTHSIYKEAQEKARSTYGTPEFKGAIPEALAAGYKPGTQEYTIYFHGFMAECEEFSRAVERYTATQPDSDGWSA